MPPNFGFCEAHLAHAAPLENIVVRYDDTCKPGEHVCGLVTVHRYDVGYRCRDHAPLVIPGVLHNAGRNRKQRRAQGAKARR